MNPKYRSEEAQKITLIQNIRTVTCILHLKFLQPIAEQSGRPVNTIWTEWPSLAVGDQAVTCPQRFGGKAHMRGWIAATGCMLALAACGSGVPMAAQTSPGSPLPQGATFCRGWSATGRCPAWTGPDRAHCVNPAGLDARAADGRELPYVPCEQVPRRMRPVAANGATSAVWAVIDAERAAAGLPAVE
jgi:hypothetical protein